MGEFFESFEGAWLHFQRRRDPLESFYETLPEHEAILAVWLVRPSAPIRSAALGVQESFRDLDWIAPLPEHFLHVTIATLGSDLSDDQLAAAIDDARRALGPTAPFRVEYRGINCFHEAVIAEVHGSGLERLAHRLRPARSDPYLPHLSLGYFRAAKPAVELREALHTVREATLGEQLVDALHLCLVPISRARVLEPWVVAETIPLS